MVVMVDGATLFIAPTSVGFVRAILLLILSGGISNDPRKNKIMKEALGAVKCDVAANKWKKMKPSDRGDSFKWLRDLSMDKECPLDVAREARGGD